jgi:hypothetical protein
MSITFCATAKALQSCLAQLPSSIVLRRLTCGSAALEPPDPEGGATVLLEAEAPPVALYPAAAGSAVSVLSKQGSHVIVAPSLLQQSILAFPDPAAGALPRQLQVGALGSPAADRPLLASANVQLLLLQDHAIVTYAPATSTVTVAGDGCAVLFSKKAAAGTAPAAITVNVLAPGMSLAW